MKILSIKVILAILLCLSICICGIVIASNILKDDLGDNDQTGKTPEGGSNDDPKDVTTQPCMHEYGTWTVIRESTCTEKGSRTRACTVCQNDTQTEELPLLPHEYIFVGQITDCDGSTLYSVEICLHCMDIHGLEDAPMVIHPHEFERRSPIDPTCTQTGVEVWFECKKCGYDVRKMIDALGHLPGSMAHDDPENDIYHYHICQRTDCGVHLYDETHAYIQEVLVAPTCTTAGSIRSTCWKCGHTKDDILPAGHIWGEWYLTESNPDNPCEYKKVCLRCGLEEYKTEHNWGDWVLSNANPENACEHTRVCLRCEREDEPKTIHVESEWVYANNPAVPCEYVQICPRCSQEWEREIRHLMGEWYLTNNPENPCEHKKECQRCDAEEYDTIHDFGEWQADPLNPCHFYRECRRCGLDEEKIEHIDGEPISFPPTCTREGYRFQLCKRCYRFNYNETIPALGHSEKYEYDEETHYLRCQRTACRERLSEDEAHTLTIELKTRTADGYYYYLLQQTCHICGYKKDLSEELIHFHDKAGIIDRIDPTCTEIGYDYGIKCSAKGCEEIIFAPAELPALGHNYVNRVCTRCGDILPSEGMEYTLSEDETYYILSNVGTCIDTKVYIPDEHGGLPVREIGSGVFRFAEHITYVDIPDTITTIGQDAFWGCTSLESIMLPDSITHIGSGAFVYCESLTEVSIPHRMRSISESLFLNCLRLVQIELPDSIRAIEPSAFSGCASLVSITIPSSVQTIGDDAFFGCWKLVEIINHSALPLSLSNDFWDYGCITGNAKEIHSGETRIKNYNDYLFCTYDDVHYLLGYVGDDTDLVLPENYYGDTYHIIDSAFWGRTDLTSVVIGNGVTEIHYGAFLGCTSLKSVTFGTSIEQIDTYAFSQCSGLTELLISKNITYISDYAFSGCAGLMKIVVEEENPNYHSSGNCLIATKRKILILGCRSSIIPSDGSVTAIASEAFYQNEFLTSITIPNDITEIGNSSFEGCKNLKRVIFEENSCLARINRYAFFDCESLTGIFIPAGVTYIDSEAFGSIWYKLNSLESIVVEEGNTTYHSDGNCLIETETKTLLLGSNNCVIPSDGTVTKIADAAFGGCIQLTSIQIPNTVTHIGNGAFMNCTSLTRIVIPNYVVHIGNSAFYGCENLMSVTLGSSVETIDEAAFYGCYRLVEVINLSSRLLSCGSSDHGGIAQYAIEVHSGASRLSDMGGYMFYRGMQSNYLVGYVGDACALILPSFSDGTTYEIYRYAFQYCDRIVSVTIPESVTKIGENAFEYCYRLVEVISHLSAESFDLIGQGYISNYLLEIHSETSKIVEYQDFLFYTYNGTHYLIDYLGEESNLVLPENYYGEEYVIHNYAFNGLENLVSIVIPDSVERIGAGSFWDCENLHSVVIGSGVKNVSSWAFGNNFELESVVFKNTEAWLMETTLVPPEIMENDELMAKLMTYFRCRWHS